MNEWLTTPCAPLDERAHDRAVERQNNLTKPPGSLGRLEDLAIRIAGWQGTRNPQVENIRIAIFAGDHGVAEEGVSAFPQSVTVEMVRNFARGGAAISVLSAQMGAGLEVINVGTVTDPGPLENVLDARVAPGTANMAACPAMTEEELSGALAVGRDAAARAMKAGHHLFIGGEMGIGNTTVAAALACALLDRSPAALAGPGTGLDADGVEHKRDVIERALTLHLPHCDTPLETLKRLGGLEIAALAGAFVTCAQQGLPILVDGFIASVAALAAERLRPGASHWMLFAHRSAEPGHAAILKALDAAPLLDLGMRLGEGSGAAVAVPLLRHACALHNGMATFAEAGVAEKNG